MGSFTGVDDSKATPFIVELVAEIRETLVQTYEDRYEAVAQQQIAEVFVKESPDELRNMADMFAIPADITQFCAYCRADASERCSRCKQEWYCSRECQVKHWKQHKAICDCHVAAAVAKAEPLIEDITQMD